METCDVCDKPAHLTCENCHEAVYCGVECQKIDYEDHFDYDCFHPDEMSDDHIADEVQIRIETGMKPGVNERAWIEGLFGTKKSRAKRKERRAARKKKPKKKRKRKWKLQVPFRLPFARK